MGIFLNILVILFSIIIFLFLYYITLKKDRKTENYRPPINKLDLEAGEELGVDEMYEDIKNKEKEVKLTEREVMSRDEPWLREKYGKDFVRLIARDPNYLFAYWEINNQEFYQNQPVLRLVEEDYSSVDIQINHDTMSWYLNSQPDKSYSIIIGYLRDGVFHPLVKSNTVRTPLDRPSHIIDEHWMTIEELSGYSIRIEMDTLSMIKNIEGRKKAAEINVDSYSFIQG